MSRIPLCLLLLLLGCFRELGAVHNEPDALPALNLLIRDLSGAVWEPHNCPRNPVFVLRFEGAIPDDAMRHALLVRGTPDEPTLTNLASGKPNAASLARLVSLRGESAREGLLLRPESALLPTAHYTLLWVERSGAVQLPIVVSESPAAGAQLVQSLPAPLDARVPPNLARALLRFDGYVLGDVAGSVRLEDARDARLDSTVELFPCAALGLGAGDCISITPAMALEPGQRYHVRISDGLRDATQAQLSPIDVAFDTSAADDATPPALTPLDCARDETRHGALCLLPGEEQVTVRARADENGLLTLSLAPHLHAAMGAAGEYTLHAPLARSQQALLVLSDPAGNRSQLELSLSPAQGLATVSIDEVRTDPLGPEPSQEYVELLNFGDQPVSIMGFTLTVDPYTEGQRIGESLALAPGERVLLVAPDFDVQDESDGPAASGARIARLPRALSLRNDGAALYLRDAQGRRVSSSPALAPGKPGQCIVRGAADRRGPRGFVQEPSGSCTPGVGSEVR